MLSMEKKVAAKRTPANASNAPTFERRETN